jgi:WD40 repeat protein
MRNIFSILFLLFTFNISAQTVNFTGILTLSNGTPLSFEIEIIEDKGIVNGFSITGKGTIDETKSDISGIYNRNTKTYKLKETQVLETNSEADINTFCYIHMEIKEVGKLSLKRYEGTFTGYFINGKECANGKIVLMEKEKLEKKIAKVNKKINKKIEKEKKKKKKETIKKEEKKEEVILTTKVLKDGDDMIINCKSDKMTIYIWDANKEDGDKINLTINGSEILKDFTTKRKRKKVKYKLKEGENTIEITATNLGITPPNTSRIEIVDSKTKYPIITQLELGKSAIITIIK